MRRDDDVNALPLPIGLTRLLTTGIWPSPDGPSMNAQQFCPIVPAERVRRFAAEESLICLQRPPFPTIAQEMAAGRAGDFWERFGALHQIVPEQALIIGDFGLGSDAPIVLDFSRNMSDPPVLRLRWNEDARTEWVEGASNFDDFAVMLGLTGDVRGSNMRSSL